MDVPVLSQKRNVGPRAAAGTQLAPSLSLTHLGPDFMFGLHARIGAVGPPLRSLVPVPEDEVALVLQRYLPDDLAEVSVELAAAATLRKKKWAVCAGGGRVWAVGGGDCFSCKKESYVMYKMRRRVHGIFKKFRSLLQARGGFHVSCYWRRGRTGSPREGGVIIALVARPG